jgi:hypothetical protein
MIVSAVCTITYDIFRTFDLELAEGAGTSRRSEASEGLLMEPTSI